MSTEPGAVQTTRSSSPIHSWIQREGPTGQHPARAKVAYFAQPAQAAQYSPGAHNASSIPASSVRPDRIQLRLDNSDQADVVTYSQHRTGVSAVWSQLEQASTPDGTVPVTYSARGSHANLLRTGIVVSTRSVLPDHNDGESPQVRPDVVALSDIQAPWSLWPGTWGGNRAVGVPGNIGITAKSPPTLGAHRAWSDPAGYHVSCELAYDLPPPGQHTGVNVPRPPAPELTVAASSRQTLLHYSIGRGYFATTRNRL